ncbi:ABC transporter arginine-binding protein 1 precursor [Serratia plymuthica]|uniref:ABC transporter arginine-binding protein 1 n=1 Tax=Serratia plymuthica TaxID=82996 RepID=A0A2X4UMH7_SERPL|nr:ABC transporter arginine-binding protein 1 precursor [Serratia plymuthica]
MKKTLAVLLTSLALGGPAAAQSFDTISFGVDGGYPPFDVLSPSGEITGFDIDIANALCTQLHAKCVFVKQPFESMIAALNARKFDAIIASLTITDERKRKWTLPIATTAVRRNWWRARAARCCRMPPA